MKPDYVACCLHFLVSSLLSEFVAGLQLTSDEDVNIDGGGANDDGLDILVVAAVVSGVPGLSPQQGQPFAVRRVALPRTLTDNGDPLVRTTSRW